MIYPFKSANLLSIMLKKIEQDAVQINIFLYILLIIIYCYQNIISTSINIAWIASSRSFGIPLPPIYIITYSHVLF